MGRNKRTADFSRIAWATFMPAPPANSLFDGFAFEVGERAEVNRPGVEFFDAAG